MTVLQSILPLLLANGVVPSIPPETFRDCEGCPVMVQLPAGSFIMGIAKARELSFGYPEASAGMAEPLRQVTFARGFAMGQYPVTIAEFRQFVDVTGYRTAESCFTQHLNDGHFIYEEVRGYTWRSPGYPVTDRHPVVCITAEDAEAYAAWLSETTGHAYAVSNEAQFEYAARAGATTAHFWADERSPEACLYSNQPDLTQAREMNIPAGPEYRFQCEDGYTYTSPVGVYRPNAWGLYDMQGNIWHWAADCWNRDFTGAPTDGSTWRTGDCDARPSRGGSFGNAAFSSYVATRAPRHASFVGHSWGFRVVRTD